MTSIADYLRGYVAGYWEGFDFGVSDEGRIEGSGSSADGSAIAPTPAPGPDPSSRRSAPGSPPEGAPKEPEGSHPSAVSSLPAIRQAALPAGVEVEGEIERLHHHRGIILGLRIAQAEMFRIDLPEAEQAIAGLLLTEDWRDVS